ncbi:diguanylate cyclase (GGDEF) domain-containing protein [Gracilibacillus ureilyticus]|uniref:Diguanylate cyclase (GGDEF) domain-containing protein n=1 Tax=Gracilibacillus ureilyticus TaxID=531814 RepID=A0A1H9NI77_9BACI|nr:diguanylate cyclase [Gracilibacillus ureilyticus]SER35674.1 diguanylate cyclase (GGDEF) domain-containing protein [Gracilibacillus ureilyticus]
MKIEIGDIVEYAVSVSADTANSEIDQLFKNNIHTHGIVITEEETPTGIITRTDFYQKLGSLYGFNLYINRPVSLLIKEDILCFDYHTSIIDVSEKAMDRSSNELYDDIIVTRENQFYGVVSIRSLLMTFASIQSQVASSLNPLTKLPGNRIIDEHIQALPAKEKYTVLYIDLDHFKVYNDMYGFAKGDRIIQETASILQAHAHPYQAFVGHIGGDDFIVILYSWECETLCEEIINTFDQSIASFYTTDHQEQGYVLAENRNGIIENIPLVSISIAAVSNQFNFFKNGDEIVYSATKIKKECKAIKCSCFITNETVNYS